MRNPLTLTISVGALCVVLPAQADLAAPLPSLETERFEAVALPTNVPVQDAEKEWKSSLNLGASIATGNTNIRTANLAGDATRKKGRHETKLFVLWNYQEQKDNTTLMWELNQRRTIGGATHRYYLNEDERTYTFLAIDAENNFAQAVDLRFSATVGVGHIVVKEDDLTFGVELGAGYFLEQSRTAGVPDAENATGRAGTSLDWKINKDFQLLHDIKYLFSLEDSDEMFGQSDARLRAAMGEGMFAQFQWILQWDNTPARRANGTRFDSLDHLFLLSIGWTF